MKNIILLILLFPTFLFAQDCKFQTNETDPYTKKVVKITKQEILRSEITSAILVQGVSDDVNIAFNFYIMYPNIFSFSKGDNILFLDENEKVYTFEIQSDGMADASVTRMGTFWSANILTRFKDDFSELDNLIVRNVRVETSDSFIEFEIKQKRGDAIEQVFNCIK